MSDKKKEKCFIITPIGDDTDPIRRHIEGIIDAAITPALGEKYEIVVAHKISEPGSITKQIISEIYNAKLVVANITNRNPNVMYELALRHAIGKPVITIAERGTPLPADIISERTIFYYNDAKGTLELTAELIKAEQKIDFAKKGGPIVDVLGDISHEAVVLKEAQQKNGTAIEPLEYIMNRLNRIEDAVTASRGRIDGSASETPILRNPDRFLLNFEYSGMDESYNPKLIFERLTNGGPEGLHSRVLGIHNLSEQKKIIVWVDGDIGDGHRMANYCKRVLTEFGFKDVRLLAVI